MLRQAPSSPAHNEAALNRSRRSLTVLGAVEAVLGLIGLVLGIVAVHHAEKAAAASTNRFQPYFRVGQGIWGSVWIIIAGILGIISGRKRISSFSRVVVYVHMAFSILAAVISGAMLISSFVFCAYYYFYDLYALGLEIGIAVASLCTLVLCVVSAVLCCCLPPTDMGSYQCCPCCADPEQGREDYVMTNEGAIPMQQTPTNEAKPEEEQAKPEKTEPEKPPAQEQQPEAGKPTEVQAGEKDNAAYKADATDEKTT